MIVCLCYNISDRDIAAQVKAGARTAADVARACGAGAHCGACTKAVAQLVDEETRRQSTKDCACYLPILGEGCHEGA